MKQSSYEVRGTVGDGKTELVTVSVAVADYPTATFTFRGENYAFRPRHLSPHPERVYPSKVPLDLQSVVKSIAKAAFDAAKKAAEEDARVAALAARDAEQEGMSLDDITMAGVARRTMGVRE